MKYPAELKYSKQHLWVKMDGDVAVVGITDFAQDSLGDLVYFGLPETGDTVTAGEAFGEVESVKTNSELVSPVSGTVSEVNEALMDAPDDVNMAPYRHWIIKVESPTGLENLMDAQNYQAFCEQ